MPKIQSAPLPNTALLQRDTQRPGCYTDCFVTTVARPVTLADFITAFYTTRLFRLERRVLTLMGHGATDADVAALAQNTSQSFAAWTVEARSDTEVLLCDVAGATRSWLRVDPSDHTQLSFGSAIMPQKTRASALLIRLTTPLHSAYSRALLRAAARNITR